MISDHAQDVIDDTEFAKLFAHTKWRHYHWAPARISMVGP